MAGACSGGLRSRVLAAVEAGETPEAAARRFAEGRSTACRWVQAAHDEGRREAKPTRGGPAPRIQGAVEGNLPAHKATPVRALLDASGFAYRCLPPYSPDLDPSEPGWAKVKAEPRRVAARTADALHEALGAALARTTPLDAAGFFRHCGCNCPD